MNDAVGRYEELMIAHELVARFGEWVGAILANINNFDLGGAVFGCGLIVLILTLAVSRVREKRAFLGREIALETENARLRLKLETVSALIASEPQVFATWRSVGEAPSIDGDVRALEEATGATNLLAFGTWLPPARAQLMDTAVDALKMRGEGFQMMLQAKNGRHLEADGRAVAGQAVVRLRDVSTQRQDTLELGRDHENLKVEAIGLRAMLDTLAQPIWLRDRNGRLSWVNEPYAFAVEAASSADVVARQIEFLDAGLRQEAIEKLASGNVYHANVPSVVAGQRRIFDVVETPLASGSLGYASDISDLEAVRSDLQRQMASHVRTLDQLPTAVAIFNEKQRLTFCNLAYRTLWQLDQAFTSVEPTDSEILDRLRDARRLPEQADYKSWKKSLFEAYRSLETQETAWYLPDGRTLRVVVNPNPQGGVTYLFDDLTEQFHLKSSYNSLTQVQSETLDSLKEGVAVFGPDGRLKLNNPAFEGIWGLEANHFPERPHIDKIILQVHHLYADVDVWAGIRGAIVGLSDARHGQSYRMERHDGSIIDCALAPLPDGATLVTFTDVSASVNVERALKERNDALEQAGQLRENFVHHVSYQLRSPLTNVIGFTELLADGTAGPLNERQSEYAGHVIRSSNALMAIIDDILDLASFDRGEIALNQSLTDIRATIDASVEGVQDRIAEAAVHLAIDVPDDIGTFEADAKRIRQILFNLLSNAIGFSSAGHTVTVSARKMANGLVLTVRDEGRGIPPDVIDRVFDRFESNVLGSRHRGVGLGLSIVRALVELHGGRVKIVSQLGAGTLVTCVFPGAYAGRGSSEAA